MPDFMGGLEIGMPHVIGRCWSWWTRELAALIPEGLLRLLFGGQRLVVEQAGEGLLLSRVNAGKLEPLAELPLHSGIKRAADRAITRNARSLVLYLPAELALVRVLTLPLATAENLREVLAFEMDRKTPYRVEQVYYDFCVQSRDPDNGTIEVAFIVAPRDRVDPLLDSLKTLGLEPESVTLRDDSTGAPLPVNLLPAGRRPRRAAAPRWLNGFLGVLILLLLAIVVALPVVAKRQAIDTLRPELERLSQEAREAHALRTRVERVAAESRFLASKKQSALPVLEVLGELTRLLPDDTWISHLELGGSEVQIHGQSQASSVLISLAEASPLLHDARFRSPVTRNRRADTERFHLSAEIQREISP